MTDLEIRFDPVYIEEAVFLALKAREAAGDVRTSQAFHAAWDVIYDSKGSAETRETDFQQLAARYFQELGLRDLIMKRFEEFPFVRIGVHVVMIRRAWSRKEECVELYVHDSSRILQMALQTSRPLEPERFIAFLRHELMHVSDMLDPAFGYEPHPDLGGMNGPEEDLLRERFRVLWNIFVDGRIRRRDWPTVMDETARRKELERAFSSWDPRRRQALFDGLLAREQCTQRELLELAKNKELMQPSSVSNAVSRREFLRSAPRHLLGGIQTLLGHVSAPIGQEEGSQRIAILDSARCLAWGGSSCQVCYLQCPLRDEAIVLDDGRPLVVASRCDGCGVCVESCRTVNDLGAIWLALKPGCSIETLKIE